MITENIATPIGTGCRKEGPHGPTPCGNVNKLLDASECDCGCTAFEDVCETFGHWLKEQHMADAVAHPKRQLRNRIRPSIKVNASPELRKAVRRLFEVAYGSNDEFVSVHRRDLELLITLCLARGAVTMPNMHPEQT